MLASVAILAVAAAIAGKPVSVTCEPGPAFNETAASYGYVQRVAAFAEVGGERVWLRNGTCRVLDRVAAGEMDGFRHWAKVGRHVLVLGHELAHTRGLTHEAQAADCFGYKVAKRAARLLGHAHPFRVRDWAHWWSRCPL